MNATPNRSLWESIPNYQRRNPESINPPSERIDPDIEGSHFWVIIVTNWHYMHPLVQDVLYIWYKELTRHKGGKEDELDPKSTEALLHRFNELDGKIKAFDLERSNLEQELNIRDRDFQRLRSITGKREKENIEVQQMLGKSFQDKIMQKQEELDQKEDVIRELKHKMRELESQIQIKINPPPNETGTNTIIIPESCNESQVVQELKHHLDERTKLLRQVGEKLKEVNDKFTQQKHIIADLQDQVKAKDERIKEIKSLLQI
ncbi:MAG: hypothetical protein JXA54_00730 [Candidatus Heimdallarchaeota archaeon]|nr:hypothetical protein [Candidatus Heimdallarchaeota archaeon]